MPDFQIGLDSTLMNVFSGLFLSTRIILLSKLSVMLILIVKLFLNLVFRLDNSVIDLSIFFF
jgi:hypothetical protein